MEEKHLYLLTSFLCGLCVMGVEMSAVRLLSPYFGSTNVIWTVIICLIMVGLCAGNFFGGLLADKWVEADDLFTGVAAGSVFIALIPFFSWPIVYGALQFVNVLGVLNAPLYAAILSCITLFIPPVIILGMMSPYLAKLCVSDLSRTGVTLGRLNALSTIGGIIGSVLPMFVLIPLIGTKLSFTVFAGLLFLPCLLFWLKEKEHKSGAIGTCVLLLAVGVAFSSGRAIMPGNTGYETESSYQYLRVQKTLGHRVLSSGIFSGAQSIRPNDPKALTGVYLDVLAALPALKQGESPANALVIGYGGGVLSTLFDAQYGDVKSTFVEIDPAMIKIAREHFDVNPNDHVVVDDGRRFLQMTGEQFDVIMVDAYQDLSIPVSLITREFFELCALRLTPEGMCAMNVAMAGSGSDFNHALGETMKQVFSHVAYIPAGGSNAIFVGSKVPLVFEGALSRRDQNWPLWKVLDDMRKNVVDAPLGGEVMTDDRNNAEILQLKAYTAMRKWLTFQSFRF